MFKGARFKISTQGLNDIIDITERIVNEAEKSSVKEGICLVFVAHSTCALATIEYEKGVIEDLKRALEILAPMNENYEHSKKWGDCNGYAHVRAALMNPFLTLPISEGKLVLGQWQQVVLIDFDNRPREREIIIKIIQE
jgi:secondary thiamine-phosphate synthase enzyme